MKLHIVLLVLLLGCSLGLMAYIQSKRKLEVQLNKTHYFEQIKHKVTNDVLVEFKDLLLDTGAQLESTKTQLEKLKVEVQEVQKVADMKKADVGTCNEELKKLQDQAVAASNEKTKTEADFKKKTGDWKAQKDQLKKEMQQHSIVCSYVDKTSPEGTKLCGIALAAPPNNTVKEAPKSA
ncbi:uncharacterized protein zgc:174935 [Trichomycterus rosablanca]|uniref:uncharacterized protein zgc:174935 n=1 Tax=Trichomycterus rosablanca TaxID=2290929 RepID=UPI002F35C9F7